MSYEQLYSVHPAQLAVVFLQSAWTSIVPQLPSHQSCLSKVLKEMPSQDVSEKDEDQWNRELSMVKGVKLLIGHQRSRSFNLSLRKLISIQ